MSWISALAQFVGDDVAVEQLPFEFLQQNEMIRIGDRKILAHYQ